MVRVLLGKLTLLVGQTLLLFDNPCIDLFNFSWCILYYAAFWCIAHIMVHSLYAVINVWPAGCFVTSLGLYYMSMKMITRAWPASCFVTRGDMLWHRAATATQGKAFNTSSWTHLCHVCQQAPCVRKLNFKPGILCQCSGLSPRVSGIQFDRQLIHP